MPGCVPVAVPGCCTASAQTRTVRPGAGSQFGRSAGRSGHCLKPALGLSRPARPQAGLGCHHLAPRHGSPGRPRGWPGIRRSRGAPPGQGMARRAGSPGRSGRAGPWALPAGGSPRGDCPARACGRLRRGPAGRGRAAPRRLRAGSPTAGAGRALHVYGLPQCCFGRTREVIGVAVAWHRVRRRLRTVPVPHVDHMEPRAAESGLSGRPAQGRCRCRGAVDPDQYLPGGSSCHHRLPALLPDPVPGHAVRPCQPARVLRSTSTEARYPYSILMPGPGAVPARARPSRTQSGQVARQPPDVGGEQLGGTRELGRRVGLVHVMTSGRSR